MKTFTSHRWTRIALFAVLCIAGCLLLFYVFTLPQNTQQSTALTKGLIAEEGRPGPRNAARRRRQKAFMESAEPLPQRVLNRIKLLVLFIGHSRSGHSIVGSILDSHPHIVMSRELGLLRKMLSNQNWDKSMIINALWQRAVSASLLGHRTETADEKGYTLAIPGLYQGRYESYIDVIGDKKALETAALLANNSTLWKQTFDRLESVTGLSVKLFHVIRNPFDNIATLVFYNAIRSRNVNTDDVVELKQNGYNYSFDHHLVDLQIARYFKLYQAAEDARLKFGINTIQIHVKDLITNPKKVIIEICEFLQVPCSDHFVSVCGDKIFPKESKTRYQIHWSDYQIKEIQKSIGNFNTLFRYADFDS